MAVKPTALSLLSARVESIDEAVQLGEGRINPDSLAQVENILNRTAGRRELSAEHTVIGFFGATGSGKSSLFNAVIGRNVARSAARRPTTAHAQAAVWGREGSEELLNWLQVENRTFFDDDAETAAEALNSAEVPVNGGLWNRMKSMVGKGATETKNGGLILLDLPDFDSVEKSNREIVERMAGYVDVLVWVFDPQKYADAVIHHDFIAPLAEHGAVMMAVLNQADRLDDHEIPGVLDSMQRLLAEDGLSSQMLSQPLAVSAKTGYGIEKLRTALGRVAVEKSAAVQRIEADLDSAVAELEQHDGRGIPDGVTGSGIRMLEKGLYESSGSTAVVKAAADSYSLHAASNTGWIATRWLLKFRKDPLKRLNLHREDEGAEITRSSLPPLTAGQRSGVSSSIRRFANSCADGVVDPWSRSIRDAARSHEVDLPLALERAIANTEYKAQKKMWWWYLLNAFQWLGIMTALIGLLWLTGLALAQYFQVRLPEPPYLDGFPLPVPTLLVITGLLFGIVIAVLGKLCAVVGRRMYEKKISKQIYSNIQDVAEQLVVEPVRSELSRHSAYCEALGDARTGR